MEAKELKDQMKIIRQDQELNDRLNLAEQGISTAVDENGKLVEIGFEYGTDYLDFKDFIMNVIVRMGIDAFCKKTDFCKDDLADWLYEASEESWRDDIVLPYFDGMGGEING